MFRPESSSVVDPQQQHPARRTAAQREGKNWEAAGTVIYIVHWCPLCISVYALNIEEELDNIPSSTCTSDCDVRTEKKFPEPVLKIDLEQIGIGGPGMIVVGSKLYLFGGEHKIPNSHDGVMRFLEVPYKRCDRVFIHDLQRHSMCPAPSMVSAKYDPYCVLVDGKICVFEGTVSAERAPNFELFDPGCLTWSRLPDLPETTFEIRACCVRETTLYVSGAYAIYCIDVASKQSEWKHYPCCSFPFYDIGYCIDGWDVCFTKNGNIDSFSKLCRPYKRPKCFDWRNASAFPPPRPTEDEKVRMLPFRPAPDASPLVRFGRRTRLTPLAGGRSVNGRPRFAMITEGFLFPEDDWNSPRCPHVTIDVFEVVKKEVLPLANDGKWSGTYEFLLINKLKSSAYSMDCEVALDVRGCFSQ